MAATKTKHKTATRKVTVSLRGWPKEVRAISVVEAYWYVSLEFEMPTNNTMTHTVFESNKYEDAEAKYKAFVKIVE